jgi:ribonuclease VapC
VAEVVLDASALLALLNAESGAEVVAEAIPVAAISAINLSEVVSKLSEAGMPERAIRSCLQPLGLEVIPFDEEQAYQAGLLRVLTRDVGLSLGDRGCLGLAKKLGLVTLTADRTWLELSMGVTVKIIR